MCKNATDNKQGYCNLAHSQTSNFIQVGAVRGHNLASNANRIDFNKEIPVDLVVCLLCCHVGQALVLHNRCEHDVKKDSPEKQIGCTVFSSRDANDTDSARLGRRAS